MSSYLNQEDTFFYAMVYDPNQKTLLVDKGDIRTGPEYQAEIPSSVHPNGKTDLVHNATQTWEPNRMPDQKVEQFLVVARCVSIWVWPVCPYAYCDVCVTCCIILPFLQVYRYICKGTLRWSQEATD